MFSKEFAVTYSLHSCSWGFHAKMKAEVQGKTFYSTKLKEKLHVFQLYLELLQWNHRFNSTKLNRIKKK